MQSVRKVFLFLVFSILFSSNSLAIVTPIKEAEGQILTELNWNQQFYLHLLASKDTDLQAFGALYLSTHLHAPFNNDYLANEVKLAIKRLAAEDHLSLQALYILISVCHEKIDPEICDSTQLIAKQIELYPDVMEIYLTPLNRAIMLGIEGEVIDLVKHMANAPVLGHYFHYSEVFEDALVDYTLQHPFTESMIDEALQEHLRLFHHNDGINEQQINQLLQQMPEYMLVIKLIVSDMSMPVLPYKGLIDACKTYEEISQECLTIAEKMTSDSVDYIGVMIGLAIPEKMYETQGAVLKHEQALIRKDQKKREMRCLVDLVTVRDLLTDNITDMYERLRLTREKGERQGMIHHANTLYQRALDRGEEAAETKNPEQCLVN